MISILRTLVVASMSLALASACQGRDVRKVSVCEIQKNPALFDGHLVEIQASVSVGVHFFNLADNQCPSTIGIQFPTDGRFGPGVEDFRALHLDAMSGRVKLRGKFQGIFRDNRSIGFEKAMEQNIPILALELSAVRVLDIERHDERAN